MASHTRCCWEWLFVSPTKATGNESFMTVSWYTEISQVESLYLYDDGSLELLIFILLWRFQNTVHGCTTGTYTYNLSTPGITHNGNRQILDFRHILENKKGFLVVSVLHAFGWGSARCSGLSFRRVVAIRFRRPHGEIREIDGLIWKTVQPLCVYVLCFFGGLLYRGSFLTRYPVDLAWMNGQMCIRLAEDWTPNVS